jgi:hypothetical protein
MSPDMAYDSTRLRFCICFAIDVGYCSIQSVVVAKFVTCFAQLLNFSKNIIYRMNVVINHSRSKKKRFFKSSLRKIETNIACVSFGFLNNDSFILVFSNVSINSTSKEGCGQNQLSTIP